VSDDRIDIGMSCRLSYECAGRARGWVGQLAPLQMCKRCLFFDGVHRHQSSLILSSSSHHHFLGVEGAKRHGRPASVLAQRSVVVPVQDGGTLHHTLHEFCDAGVTP
jgi:hypothetical protein